MIYIFFKLLFVFLVIYIYYVLGDKERHKLPHDSKVIHAEFTYYYYPGDVAFPCKLNFKIYNYL